MFLTKLSSAPHKHLAFCPWSLSEPWETFIAFYLLSFCQSIPRLTQLLNTFNAAKEMFGKNVQPYRACSFFLFVFISKYHMAIRKLRAKSASRQQIASYSQEKPRPQLLTGKTEAPILTQRHSSGTPSIHADMNTS